MVVASRRLMLPDERGIKRMGGERRMREMRGREGRARVAMRVSMEGDMRGAGEGEGV